MTTGTSSRIPLDRHESTLGELYCKERPNGPLRPGGADRNRPGDVSRNSGSVSTSDPVPDCKPPMYKKRRIFFAIALLMSVVTIGRGLLFVVGGSLPDLVTLVSFLIAVYAFWKYRNLRMRLEKSRKEP